MQILLFLGVALALLILASRFYGGFISRFLGVSKDNPTPAHAKKDGRDFVPTKTHILFAHHFSAIAGAGPIIGPTMAILYGVIPAWLWIVLGGIFIGAVHDFTTLFASIREGGKSMAEIARKTLGEKGFLLFNLFTIVMILLVTSSFLAATAVSLTSRWPIAKLGLGSDQTLLRTTVDGSGNVLGVIGGIASMSVVIITCCAPILGHLIYRRGLRTFIAYILAAIIMTGSILAGIYRPITLPAEIWMVIISIYVLLAAGVPVWIILQPRDFINVQILYGGIIAILLALLIGGGQKQLVIGAPNFNLADGVSNLGLMWPMLFITIACGAISGFHALVAGGTTSKQIASECDAKRIGYNGMLLESILAVGVILTLSSGLLFSDYKMLVWPAAETGAKANPILAFSLAVGSLFNTAFGLPKALGSIFGILLVEGFVITTLDAAVRINRYLFEELWGVLLKNPPAIMRKFWFNAGLSTLLMWVLAYFNVFSALWPIFGTSNQLLAALSLLAVSIWLFNRKKRAWFTLIPSAFMTITTITSLIILLKRYFAAKSYTLIFTDILLLAFSIGVVVMGIKALAKMRNQQLKTATSPLNQ